MKKFKQNIDPGLKLLLDKRLSKEKYTEHRAKVLLIRYKEKNDLKSRNDLVELCYPIIFSIIKRQIKKIIVKATLLNNEDLFNECIITTIKCIDGFNIRNESKARFITYLYTALDRAVLRFVNDNVLKYSQMQSNIQPFINMKDVFDEEELGVLKTNNKEIFYEQDDFYDLEKDFSKSLDSLQIKIFILRLKDIKVPIIIKVLKMNMSQYYFHLNEIKQKLQEYLYEKKVRKKFSKRRYSKRIF